MKFIIRVFTLLFANLAILSVSVLAGNYEIEVNLKQAANQKISLAYYYISNIYIKDTVILDASGSGVFKADSLLPQGLYKIYADKDNHFDLLIGADQIFSVKNTTYQTKDAIITGAVETEEFVKYVVYLEKIKREGSMLGTQIKEANGAEKEKLENQMKKLSNSLQNYWKEIDKKYPNTFLAAFLMSNLVETLDESTLPKETLENDSLLLLARFIYQKNHFWEHFDYTDERFLYTPLLKPKLETWFTKVLYPNYDSVRGPVMQIIEDVRPNKRIFQFVTSFLLNQSINSNILGMDALFVDIAKKYYLSGEATWASNETLEKVRENVLFAENNLIGKTAPNLTLESFDGEWHTLHEIPTKYSAVLIYEPNCSHCKEFVPDFHDNVYLKYRDKGFEVFAIYSMDNKEEWGEFLTKHNLYDWINVWDEHHVSRFKILYDARKTPGVFILDKDKKIVSKKLTVEQIGRFLEQHL